MFSGLAILKHIDFREYMLTKVLCEIKPFYKIKGNSTEKGGRNVKKKIRLFIVFIADACFLAPYECLPEHYLLKYLVF
ncbi:hypothetical protein BTA30_20195 [Bacillus swezeyi]|uniref:Uncharacterized protein n=1 Tax=Bacillus swezeyi TaxID=1925020 RepID=A0A1R1QSG9_9BACI|nr:hypothetical protein BW143_06830 [Bacillus swezeyi]OMI26117.1 hypothetical protein BTA30_20195 [Bacillus swezeyi]